MSRIATSCALSILCLACSACGGGGGGGGSSTHQLAVSFNGSSHGTLDIQPAGSNVTYTDNGTNASGLFHYPGSASVTITMAPDPGYQPSSISTTGNVTAFDADSYTFRMSTDATFSVTFSPVPVSKQ